MSAFELFQEKIAGASHTFACDSDPTQLAAGLCVMDLLTSLFSLLSEQAFFS